jgi:predicted RNase H-like HicB family nuclease
MSSYLKSGRIKEERIKLRMIDLKYSLIIEATEDPNFFGFYSPDLEGFSGVGHSIEDCVYKAKWGMEEHIAVLTEQGLPIPAHASHPKIVIHNETSAEVAA